MILARESQISRRTLNYGSSPGNFSMLKNHIIAVTNLNNEGTPARFGKNLCHTESVKVTAVESLVVWHEFFQHISGKT